MLVIGLTGSLGMGKSATSRMFAEAGVPVHDADAAVHRLYEGEAVTPVEAAFPGVAVDGKIDRALLAPRVVDDKEAMKTLEAIVHPLVRREEERFLARAAVAGAKFAVLDIPLLFETGADQRVDFVVVVSAPADVQRARVLRRPGMAEEKFRALLAKQMPDAEKRRRADFIVDSSGGFDFARPQVRAILRDAATRPPRSRPAEPVEPAEPRPRQP
jgi:dephospho-CoA kinase